MSTGNKRTVGLGKMLGLHPLDRLQINDKREIRELRSWKRMGGSQDTDLPFFYFQRVMETGLLEVSSPSGYLTYILPEDICDMIPGEPVTVRAMPQSVFIARLKLPLKERQGAPGPECYADANVLRIQKDRWGRVDSVFVSFVDASLNGSSHWAAPIHPEDRPGLAAKARRTIMPVMSNSRTANHSADHGVAAQQSLQRATASALFRCAKHGDKDGVEKLSMAGVKPLKQAQLNRLGYSV